MTVLKNFLWNISYQVFLLILPIVTIPYVSRVLGPTGIGINSYTNSIAQYFVLFGNLGITLYGNREVAYKRDKKKELSQLFWELSFLRFFLTFISMVIFLTMIYFTGEYQSFYLIQALLLIASALDIAWFFQGLELFRVTVVRSTLVKVVSLMLIFTFVKDKNDLGLYIFILAFSQLLGNLTLWPYLKKYISTPNIKHLNFKIHLKPTITLFIPQVATQVYLQLNKTMLGAIVGVTAAGYYDNSDKIVKIILALVTASGTVLLPHIAHDYSKGNMEKISKSAYNSMHVIMVLAMPLASGLIAVAPLFTKIFFGPGFSPVATLMRIEAPVMIMVGIGTAIGVQYLLPTNQIRIYSKSYVFGASLNVLLNIPLILLLGAKGAMIATIFSETFVSMFQLYHVRKQLSLRSLFFENQKYIFAAVIMGIAVNLFVNLNLLGPIVTLILGVLVGALSYTLVLLLLRPNVIIGMTSNFLKAHR
ncbi:flippase [Lacticaseibacillus paracasei]|uniref:flippase n=1 Tax=Lacticaseibacillus paracasei TaxID=1597 RepID=UPI0018915F78|nr:flippase [Lacticaseibacillus paracasei]QPB57555.1 oligosaccharide flippase family protein [Lacticaseibacillus paracasei]WPQ29877.1 flippase [Lacticaseibacillus paracasei]